MRDDRFPCCHADRAFCRSCPERCFPVDEPEEPKRFDFVPWWGTFYRNMGRILDQQIVPGLRKAVQALTRSR